MMIARLSKPTPPKAKIILGLDPGIERTGYGVLRWDPGSIVALRYGRIDTTRTLPLPDRLLQLSRAVEKLCRTIKPDVIAVEELFFSKNVKTAMAVSQARGVILLTIARSKKPFRSFTPNAVKLALTGYGAAPKEQVQRMLMRIFPISLTSRDDDAADALALAYCCAQNEKNHNRFKAYA